MNHTDLCPDRGSWSLTRRRALLGLTAAFTLGRTSMALAAPETDRRFVVILLRGALGRVVCRPTLRRPRFRRAARASCLAGARCRGRRAGPWRHVWPAPGLAAGARAVCRGRRAAAARGSRALPQPQPFRGAGLPGERGRPAPGQRLAEPRRQPDAGTARPRPGVVGRAVGAAAAARPGHRRSLGAGPLRQAHGRPVSASAAHQRA